MAPWSVLEITEGSDARNIKRAYATKLKVTRPDDDPQGFQKLHDAYKWALELDKYRQQQEQEQQERLAQQQQQQQQKQLSSETESLIEDLSHSDSADDILEAIANAEMVAEDDGFDEGCREIDLGANNSEVSAEHTNSSDQKVETVDEADRSAEDQEQSAEAPDPELEIRIEEYQRLLTQVEEVLSNNRLYPQESNWKFLEDTPYLLDEDFNWNLGLQVFFRILQHNIDALDKGNNRARSYSSEVTDNVIHYCDLLFGWRANAQYLYAQADEQGGMDGAIVLDKLADGSAIQYPSQPLRGGAQLVLDNGAQYQSNDNDEGQFYYFGGLFQRALAVLIDFFILFTGAWGLLSVVQFLFGQPESDELEAMMLGLAFIGYFFMALIMESSPWQATPGKRLLGFKVTRKDLSPMGYGLGLWRMTAFILTLPFLKITWIINAFLGGNLLHDRLSRTHVINTRKR